MPSIEKLNLANEKVVDLTNFFGEEAYVTIKRLNKFTFNYLSTRMQKGYSALLFQKSLDIIRERPNFDPNQKLKDIVLTYEEMIQAKEYFTTEESLEFMKIEQEVEKMYFKESILPDKHNFTDNEGSAITIDGVWFYDKFSGVTFDNITLADKLLREITEFNREGIVLGE